MLLQCPACGARLRYHQPDCNSRLVTLNCPRCTEKLKLRIAGSSPLKVLIAHEDLTICRQLLAQLQRLPVSTRICGEPQEVIRHLIKGARCLLLIDVAFTGGFPFELIARAKRAVDAVEHKVILLASVYNKTAYKKRPMSLYGADSYLELHHIGDRLLPVVAELFPHLGETLPESVTTEETSGERLLAPAELRKRALTLSRVLIADIALYHQDRLLPGLQVQEARRLFEDCLKEGRRLLLQRLPDAATLPQDYLQQAFDEFYESYSCHRLRS